MLLAKKTYGEHLFSLHYLMFVEFTQLKTAGGQYADCPTTAVLKENNQITLYFSVFKRLHVSEFANLQVKSECVRTLMSCCT